MRRAKQVVQREWPFFLASAMCMWIAAICGYHTALAIHKRDIQLAWCYDALINHIGSPQQVCKAEVTAPAGNGWTDY